MSRKNMLGLEGEGILGEKKLNPCKVILHWGRAATRLQLPMAFSLQLQSDFAGENHNQML